MTKSILLASVLALGAAHCGASSNRESNMPESSATEPAASESGGTSVPEPTAGVGMGQDPASAEQAGTQFERNPNDASTTDTLYAAAADLDDQQIAAITDKVNTAEIEQARIAQTKSKNERVRRFAEMMIEHHGRAKTQQQALGLSTAESPLSRQLEKKSMATLETLKAKSGEDFDRAYLQAQVERHQQALETIRQLQPNVKDSELRSYLQELTPQVEQHLEQARAAQQSLQMSGATGARSGSTGPTGMR